MPQPIESLDRPALERRYRRMRLATTVLAAVTLALMVALGAQSAQGARSAPLLGTGNADSTTQQSPAAPGADTPGAQQCPVEDRRVESDPRALGAVDAPVVLHEWTDFQCPYCGAFSRDTMPVLIEEYVNTGKVRLEVHDAALVGGDTSVEIAAAVRAAGDQGRYFEYYDEVYLEMAAQGESRATYDRALLITLAERAGVPDLETFAASIDSGEHKAGVLEETEHARNIGVNGVPFFSTSGCGTVLSGAQPIDSFRAALDEVIAAAVKQ